MIIRLSVENLYSFGRRREFNTLPAPKFSRLKHHRYEQCQKSFLKMSSIYGANGAGKSNFVKAVETLQSLVLKGRIPPGFSSRVFRFKDLSASPASIVIEFINEGTAYLYGVEIAGERIVTEELYISGLGKSEDSLVYIRKTDEQNQTDIEFLKSFEKDKEGKVLKQVIIKNLVKANMTVMRQLAELENPILSDTQRAYDWFLRKLQIVMPESRPIALAHLIDIDPRLKKYADEMMLSLHLGIDSLESVKIPFNELFGHLPESEIDKIKERIDETPEKILNMVSPKVDEITIVKDGDEYYGKQLKIIHYGVQNRTAHFILDEESDGTVRLLDFVPAFNDIVNKDRVYIIDEIERSVHPLLIKELIRKFSEDTESQGQLIFTTHESNLLDLSIFRQDEIWFVEKDKNGMTDMYSLSDYKQHNTTDIRKGYLTGRYGSIPFLANLRDLNWRSHDS